MKKIQKEQVEIQKMRKAVCRSNCSTFNLFNLLEVHLGGDQITFIKYLPGKISEKTVLSARKSRIWSSTGCLSQTYTEETQH